MSRIAAIKNQEIISTLKDFAETQEKLIFEFQKQYHFLSSDASLLKQPKTGFLSAMEEKWRFQKHGVGIVFEGERSGKIIDAHKRIISNKKAFDSWRLAEYFESIDCYEISWASDTFVADDDDDLDRLLELLMRANLVKLVSERDKLYELIES